MLVDLPETGTTKPTLFEMIRPTFERWAGVAPQEASAIYGVRVYTEGSRLNVPPTLALSPLPSPPTPSLLPAGPARFLELSPVPLGVPRFLVLQPDPVVQSSLRSPGFACSTSAPRLLNTTSHERTQQMCT